MSFVVVVVRKALLLAYELLLLTKRSNKARCSCSTLTSESQWSRSLFSEFPWDDATIEMVGTRISKVSKVKVMKQLQTKQRDVERTIPL